MLRDISVEHFDGFGDSIVFWCDVKNVKKEYIKKAKEIDGENFNEDCFGVCVHFDEKGFHIVEDSENHELYYIDNDGDKHYMDMKLSDKEAELVYQVCRSEICEALGMQ